MNLLKLLLIIIIASSCTSNATDETKPLASDSTKQERKIAIDFMAMFKDSAFEDFHLFYNELEDIYRMKRETFPNIFTTVY
ncbi:MAG: hypothetical protein SGJ10_01175 [Bacteroidota bacterium]|nr:hypothetical protein [Bacteroidota bacterium]